MKTVFANRNVRVCLIALLLMGVQVGIAQACPGCKQALATAEGEQANMVNGYFWSILFMLSMPFTLVGLFCGSMYLAVRKARRQQSLQSASIAAANDEMPVGAGAARS